MHTAGMTDLSHVALPVRDPHRSLAFYRDAIGLGGAIRPEPYGYVVTCSNGVTVTLFSGVPPASVGEFHIGVSLPDGDAVRAARDRFRAAGLTEHEWCEEPGYVSVKVVDPDGYVVEVSWDEV
jgi:catechol 2,3-dioxygenase-like lactoylglutathione lyase family enzyme